MEDAQVAAPATGIALYCSTAGEFKFKDSSGNDFTVTAT
jgi:hypothetical protein